MLGPPDGEGRKERNSFAAAVFAVAVRSLGIRKRIVRLVLVAGAFGVGLSVAASSTAAAMAPGAYTTRGAWSFQSAPRLHPPRLRTDTGTAYGRLATGYFLTANFPNIVLGRPLVGQGGPLILDSHLQPVWFDPAPTNVVALDLKQQTFDGKPALSWWEGVISNVGATTSGTVFVVDQHYRQLAKLTGDTADGWVISPHDVVISGHDAWVTSYKYLHYVDLSAYGGAANGTLYDSAVQEYDLRTGKLLYTWDAYNPGRSPNVPLSQSEAHAPAVAGVPWDAYHENSIQLVGHNEFLVSMRNTWAGYLVDIKTGKVLWTLGGKASSFTIPTAAQFEWQHHINLLPGNLVTIYDDHCCAIVGAGKFAAPTGPSRGLVLKLNVAGHSASFVHQYTHGRTFDSAFTGSMQLASNGNAVVGWGSLPYFSEYSGSGKLLLDAVWPTPDLSYRVLLSSNWVGTPSFSPSGAVRRSHGGTWVYASWDGATKVASWRVIAGSNARHLRPVATRRRGGFETAIGLGRRTYSAYRVVALDASGHVLGRSALLPPKRRSGPSPQGY